MSLFDENDDKRQRANAPVMPAAQPGDLPKLAVTASSGVPSLSVERAVPAAAPISDGASSVPIAARSELQLGALRGVEVSNAAPSIAVQQAVSNPDFTSQLGKSQFAPEPDRRSLFGGGGGGDSSSGSGRPGGGDAAAPKLPGGGGGEPVFAGLIITSFRRFGDMVRAIWNRLLLRRVRPRFRFRLFRR